MARFVECLVCCAVACVVSSAPHGNNNGAPAVLSVVEAGRWPVVHKQPGAVQQTSSPCAHTRIGKRGPYLCVAFITVAIVEYPATQPLEELLVGADLGALLAVYLDDSLVRVTMPPAIGQCTKLKMLYIGRGVRGPLPSELGSLCQLRVLSLYGVIDVGPLPDLQCLTQLQALDHSRLQGASGELAQLWGPSLQRYRVAISEFTGTLTSKIGVARNLVSLLLSENQLSGTLPSQMGLLSNLKTLELYDNRFNGSLPFEIGGATNLTVLKANKNRLSGELPSELNNLAKLQILDLGDNTLEGKIPANLSGLVLLERLDLHNNSLRGEVPATVGHLASLQYLDLSFNQLSGTLPHTMVALTRLHVLLLNDNQLTGTLGQLAHSLVSITDVDTRHNDFSGKVPGGAPWTENCWDSGLENDECLVPCDCDPAKGKLLWHRGDAHGHGCECVHVEVLCIAPAILLVAFVSVLFRSKLARRRKEPRRPSRPGVWSVVKMVGFGLGLAFDVLLFQIGVVQLNESKVFLGLWIGIAVQEIRLGLAVLWLFDKEVREAGGIDGGMWPSEWLFSLLSPRVMAVVMRGVVKRALGDSDKLLAKHQVRVAGYKLAFNTAALGVQIVFACLNAPDEFVSVLSLGMVFGAALMSMTMLAVYWDKHERVTQATGSRSAVDARGLRLAYGGPRFQPPPPGPPPIEVPHP